MPDSLMGSRPGEMPNKHVRMYSIYALYLRVCSYYVCMFMYSIGFVFMHVCTYVAAVGDGCLYVLVCVHVCICVHACVTQQRQNSFLLHS